MSPDSLTEATIDHVARVRPDAPIPVTTSARQEFRKFYADALELDSSAVATEFPQLLERIGNIAAAEFKEIGPSEFARIREFICPWYPWCK